MELVIVILESLTQNFFNLIKYYQASAEKSHKNLLNQLNDLGKKVEEANLTLNDFEVHKRRLTGENGDLLRVLQVRFSLKPT